VSAGMVAAVVACAVRHRDDSTVARETEFKPSPFVDNDDPVDFSVVRDSLLEVADVSYNSISTVADLSHHRCVGTVCLCAALLFLVSRLIICCCCGYPTGYCCS
jgi:hypothetical protein